MSLFTGAALIGYGLATAGGTALAAKMSSGAAKDAAKMQSDAAQEALDFTKAQKAKQEAAYAPFGALGQQAVGVLPGIARQAPTMGAPAPYTTQPAATRPMPSGMPQGAPLSAMGSPGAMAPQMGGVAAPGAAQGVPAQPDAMVLLQAPDGSQKRVPAAQADQFIARGAKRIG
jgi:hypothetical protein